CSRSCDLFLIQLASHIHSHKETFTILYHSFTNFSHSLIIFFIIIIIEYHHHLIQDYYLFFCSISSIYLSITLYMFLMIISHSHNKYHHSAHTEQFISSKYNMLIFVFIYIESSCVDRSVSANNSKLNIESLIKNLKNMIMKKLSILYMTESLTFLSTSSATASQSSTSASVSDSPASAISVFMTLTLATSAPSDFTVSAFIISSFYFKKMLYRLNKSCLLSFSFHLFFLTLIFLFLKKIIMSFTVHKVIIFTDTKKLFTTVKFNIM
ncbi:hypothetical protein BDBG_16213, partial [Blastomyces gilchristii SLH14081]